MFRCTGRTRGAPAPWRASNRPRGVLQGRIGQELRLRRVPVLHFSYDPSLDKSMRVEELLGQYEPVDLDEEGRPLGEETSE